MKKKKLPFHIKIGLPNFLWFNKGTLQAYVVTFFVFYKRETGITNDVLIHETIHVSQFYSRPFTQAFKYMTMPDWRLKFESEAYAKHLLFILSKRQDVTIYKNIENTEDYKMLFEEFSSTMYMYYNLNFPLYKCKQALQLAISSAILEINTKTLYKEPVSWLYENSLNENI